MMKLCLISLGAVALLAGCGGGDQAVVDNLVRQAVSNNGAPENIAMAPQDDGSFRGTAAARPPSGPALGFNCTAVRREGNPGFEARCVRAIDQSWIDAMESEIRQRLIASGTEVVAVELTRQSDDRMTGYAEQRVGGRTVRAPCEASRENSTSSAFTWECRPAPGTPSPGEEAR